MLHWQDNRHSQPLQFQLRGLDVLGPASVSEAGSTAFEPGAEGTHSAENAMGRTYNFLATLAKREAGQTMSEYALVLGVVMLAVLAAIGALSVAITGHFTSVTTAINGLLP
jgi:Flp pilus assembly pilin Flp